MNKPLNTYQLKDGKVLEIHIDPDPLNPREEWDNFCYMFCFHKRYDLGDPHRYRKSDYESWNEFKSQIESDYPGCIIYSLYLMDHSGLSVSINPFGCMWDSEQIGFIFIARGSAKNEQAAKEIVSSEINAYNQYLSGEVYGYIIRDKICCRCGHEGEALNSCWGYFNKDCILAEFGKDIINGPHERCQNKMA